ncbi:hypothetical protein ACTFIW_009954 [Dictyostelium discoideum]
MSDSEILFWKIWRNIYLNNLIFENLTEKPIEFTNILDFHFCNRIKFKYIKSLKWMIKRNQWALLKDKLVNNNQEIIFKNLNFAINLLIERCKDNEYTYTILETFYLNNIEKNEINFQKLNPLKLSIIKNNLIGVKVFSNYYQITEPLIENSLKHFIEKQIPQQQKQKEGEKRLISNNNNNNEFENEKKIEIIDFLINKFNNDNQEMGENNFKLPFESIEFYSTYQPLIKYLFNSNSFKVEKLDTIIEFLIEKSKNDKLYQPSNIIFEFINLNYTNEEIILSISNKPNFIIKLFKDRLLNNNKNSNNNNNNNILKNQFLTFFDELLLIPKKSILLLLNDKEQQQLQLPKEEKQKEQFNEKKPLQHFIKDNDIDKLNIKQLFGYGEVKLAIEKSKRNGPKSFQNLLSVKQFRQLIKYYDYDLVIDYIDLYLSVNIRHEYLVNRFERSMKFAKKAERNDIITYLSNLKKFNNNNSIDPAI